MTIKSIKFFTVIIGLLLFIGCGANKVNESKKEKWVQLFNGKDLKNWTIKIRGHEVNENYKNTFRVENGTIQVNYDEYDSFDDAFGHIFFNKSYSNYKFRMEYRFTGDQVKGGAGWATRNSGIMLHCQDPKTMGLDQDFPVSIEVQLLGGLGKGERSTANLCTPGTHVVINDKKETRHCINSKSKTFHGDQWVAVEVTVMNDSIISHKINGEFVMSYNKPQIGGANVSSDQDYWRSREGEPLKKGFISLQSESHPVEFRNIEILEL
jgi:hypothetical protein